MGIFKFLGKLLKEQDKEVETEIIQKEITFSELEESLKLKEKEIKEKEENLTSIVNNKIDEFVREIKEKITNVEKVDIEAKEKNDKVRSIVQEGRKKYIEFLERLIDNLEQSKKIFEFNNQIEKINSSFLKFGESSNKSYERATILIGKEMGVIKESLKKFSSEILALFKENKDIINEKKKINLIKSKKDENAEIKESLLKIKNEIKIFDEKIKQNEQEKIHLSKEIDEIKKSKEHLENIKLQEDIKLKEEEIKNEISELRQLIDFKALSNFFHIFEDRMKIVKLYKDNFASEFNEDKGKMLIELLNESKTNSDKIIKKIESISNKEKSINEKKEMIKEDKIKPVLSDIERTREKIENLKNEKEWAEKKKSELTEKEEKNTEDIKEKLKNLNIVLIQ